MLLIDEIDRTDEPFEAFLLEALSDFQVTIPELGTIRAPEPPIVILTSNRTREVHDALKRRCLYHWVDYPGFAREMEILRARAPEATETAEPRGGGLCPAAARRGSVQEAGRGRNDRLGEMPAGAGCGGAVSPEVIADTLGAILKYQDDIRKIEGSAAKKLLDEARAALAAA